MFKNKIILVLFIFTLVFAGANVFAQIVDVEEHVAKLLQTDELTEKLLDEGIDSVLKSNNLSRDSMWLGLDTLVADSNCVSKLRSGFSIHSSGRKLNVGQLTGKLIIRHLEKSRSILNVSSGFEEGFESIFGSGILCVDKNWNAPREFSFSKSIKFKTTYGDSPPSLTTPSFWDSTAKPILVTLGAVAVIALFFLIRG